MTVSLWIQASFGVIGVDNFPNTAAIRFYPLFIFATFQRGKYLFKQFNSSLGRVYSKQFVSLGLKKKTNWVKKKPDIVGDFTGQGNRSFLSVPNIAECYDFKK